jgi:transposase InsO family protein
LISRQNPKERGTHIFKVEEAAASWQAGIWLMSQSFFERYPVDLSLEEVCTRLGVGRSSAYAAADEITRRLLQIPRKQSGPMPLTAQGCRGCAEMAFDNECLRYELSHPGCRGQGEVRLHFDPRYKAFIEECRARHGLTLERVSKILGVSIDTLKKFSRYTEESASEAGSYPEILPPKVVELANEFLRSGKGAKSVKRFCERHPELLTELGMNYRQVLGWLKKLGFVSPRGIFLKNTGLDKILKFKPNQVWGSDGKKLVIIFNGEIFPSHWQCLVDGTTTAIVGGVVRDEETTSNLVDAIKESKRKTGITPLGIVIDNRLSENLPAVRPFFEENGIEIVKIFPGNPKSNANAEENFNVFERWVGAIEINGATPAEIVRSIQQAIVEIFTQMRNHKPRRGLSFKTAQEAMDESPPATPEEEAQVQAKLKELADRLKNEQARPIVSEQKKAAIQLAIDKTKPPQPEVFAQRLTNARFTPDILLQAIAILEKCRREHPEKSYGHTYYGGIVRNLADQQSMEFLNTSLEAIYVHHWDTMGRITQSELAQSLKSHPEATCTRLASDYVNMPIPAYAVSILLDLKKSFFLASQGSAAIATQLRKAIAETVLQSKRATPQRREALLCKAFEWENFVRQSDWEFSGWDGSPVGHA